MQGRYGKGKRQLDCAGVVTTALAAVQRLANHEEHADLRQCRLQVPSCHLSTCRPMHAGQHVTRLCNSYSIWQCANAGRKVV